MAAQREGGGATGTGGAMRGLKGAVGSSQADTDAHEQKQPKIVL